MIDRSKNLKEQTWAPPKVAAQWLQMSAQTLNAKRRSGELPAESFNKADGHYVYNVHLIDRLLNPNREKLREAHFTLSFIGSWERAMASIAVNSSDRGCRPVVWVEWPPRAPMSRARLVSLLYSLGAAAVIDNAGKVWSPAK